MHFQLSAMDRGGNLLTFIGKLKVDWIDFPLDDILQQFTTLKEGILRGVFKQKAAGAWFGLDVVRKKSKSLCCFLEVLISARGWSRWMVCPIVGRKAAIFA